MLARLAGCRRDLEGKGQEVSVPWLRMVLCAVAIALNQAKEPFYTLSLQPLCPQNAGMEETEGLWKAAGSSLVEQTLELRQ